MLYDIKIENVIYHCETPIESLEELYDFACSKGVSHVRQNYSDYPQSYRDIIGEYGDWMDMVELESAIYEYNNTRI